MEAHRSWLGAHTCIDEAGAQSRLGYQTSSHQETYVNKKGSPDRGGDTNLSCPTYPA